MAAAETLLSGRFEAPSNIEVRGAREHNLRALDVSIPRDKLVVITGPSGSGKSSLAFDTIYAEGQRRYVESLSAYARQFLDQMSKPDVESIEGLSPAISIEQKTIGRSRRSTVGTATEISDYLRVLFARAGTPHCPGCGDPISHQSPEEMAARVLSLNDGARVQVMSPVVRGRRGEYRKELDDFRRKGFVRVRIDGELLDLAEPIKLAKGARHDIDLVVDRVIVKPEAETRVLESIETALRLGDGLLKVDIAEHAGESAREWLLSRSASCATCAISLPEIAPRLFSFNNPYGACESCAGLGESEAIDPERVVPDPTLSLSRGAIEAWKSSRYYRELLSAIAELFDISLDSPWNELSAKVQKGILHGTPRRKIRMRATKRGEEVELPWLGVVDELERRGQEDERAYKQLAPYRVPAVCTSCDGARLRAEGRSVKIGGRSIDELSRLSIAELAVFLDHLELSGVRIEVADRVVREIADRLRFLCEVGLDYLSLDRPAATLSGGEAQRIRLATQVGASLMGVLYILDEPSIGLHPRDCERLLTSLRRLRDIGNSVLVVEHDESTIRAADFVVDMGPGAGVHGGDIVAVGSPGELAAHEGSLTGAFLSGTRSIALPRSRRPGSRGAIEIKGCSANNLKNVDVRVPLACFTVVTGVSGSGKSTLVTDTLHRALARRLHGSLQPSGAFRALSGLDAIDQVIDVNQSPIGRSPRSNPATYSGAFTGIRQLFSQVPEARARGYSPGRFSFNVKDGRCEACEGDGQLRVEMNFLPDLFVTCETCAGRRYNSETLEIPYKGETIADVLEMTVEEALGLFENVGAIARPLRALYDVGLEYLRLGQPANTLSGGEAQRIKLAKELARRSTGRTLYLLDEPTTGLHFADVEKLLEMLGRLVELGNTVLVIEHQLDVIKTADYVIDLGPEGGNAGGYIVASGTPEEVAATTGSHTGAALREVLAAGRRGPE